MKTTTTQKPHVKWSKTDLRRTCLSRNKRFLEPQIAEDGNPVEIDEILFNVTETIEKPPCV